MRLIEGRTLGEMLAETATKEPLSPRRYAVSVVEQVATALDAAHEAGLIHRDVKPSNILMTTHDFAYLIDFGLARTAKEAGLTTAGNTLGTLGYMAPERFEGGPIDGRADIYALTCVLHECLTGNRPYQADSLEQQIAGHMMSPPPRPSESDPKLVAFDEVIAKGMAKKPAKRYQTAAELAAAARRALNAPVPKGGRTSGRHSAGRVKTVGRVQGRPSGPCSSAAAAVLLVAVCAVGAWQLWGGPRRGDTRPASIAESSTPASAPDGAVPGIAATVPCRHPCDGPVGDRGQRAVRAQRVQGLVGQDRRIRRRPDERDGPHARAGAGLSRDGVREHLRVGQRRQRSTSGCRRSPTPSSGRSWSTS